MTAVLDDAAESAVRNYLLFLEDPTKLIDHDRIDQLQRKAETATDPLERLKAYAELDRAQHVDESTHKLDFILHAKSWAEANNVTATAFKMLGVPDDVLRSAGLTKELRHRRKTRQQHAVSAHPSVSVGTIKAHVRSLHGRFTLADIQSTVGGSPMTVRKGVHELVAAGAITRIGPMPDWSGRGRAPIVFVAP